MYIITFLCFFFTMLASPTWAFQASISVAYDNGITEQQAQEIAKSIIYLQILQEANTSFSNHRAFKFAISDNLRQKALISELYDAEFTIEQETRQGIATVSVKLKAINENGEEISGIVVDEEITNLINQKSILDMRTEWLGLLEQIALEAEKCLISSTGDVLEGSSVVGRVNSEIIQHASLVSTNAGTLQAKADILLRRIKALWLYNEALQYFKQEWTENTVVQDILQEAINLDADLPLLWISLAEVQLQLDLPNIAINNINKSLDIMNFRTLTAQIWRTDFLNILHCLSPQIWQAKALYIRGLAYLRMQQPALAKLDFNASLNLEADITTRLRARGVAYMVLEEFDLMCQDFERACSFGDCEGLANVRQRQFCLPNNAENTIVYEERANENISDNISENIEESLLINEDEYILNESPALEQDTQIIVDDSPETQRTVNANTGHEMLTSPIIH